MRTYASLLLALVFMAGCLSMPDPVKDEFLVEQTAAQKQKLDSLAQEIIAKRKEKEKVDEALKITVQKVVIAKKEIPVLEKENETLVEKQKLYTIENNDAMVKKTNDDIAANQTALARQKAYLKYLQALEDDQEAQIELRHAELAVYVSEMEFEKAKIARVYQEKEFGETDTPETAKDGKAEKHLIDVATYENYHVKQKSILASKTEKQKKTAEELKAAQKEMQDSGYTEK